MHTEMACQSVMHLLLSLYLSVKRSHHIRRKGLQILTLIKKSGIYTIGFYEDLKV
jgi:hypothetical protein